MLIYIDGPEKAGKTTLVDHLNDVLLMDHEMVKWSGRDDGNGFGYEYAMAQAMNSNGFHIWDRGWMSEVVYGKLLDQERRLAAQPFLGEWIYSRVMEGRGARVILLAMDPAHSAERRDKTDLPVDPYDEFFMYQHYGLVGNYQVLYNPFNEKGMKLNAMRILSRCMASPHEVNFRDYVGSTNPVITFVADHFGQIPFTDTKWAHLFAPFGQKAISRFGYANLQSFDELPKHLKSNVVAVGDAAMDYFQWDARAYMPDGNGAFAVLYDLVREIINETS